MYSVLLIDQDVLAYKSKTVTDTDLWLVFFKTYTHLDTQTNTYSIFIVRLIEFNEINENLTKIKQFCFLFMDFHKLKVFT